ncbi:MAG: hypothetical protein AABM30_00855 [Actinomycetota bacterium]
MPSRKQRRRRAKDRRHEYEYVYVDEEGREVEVAEAAEERNKKERVNGRPPPRTRAGRVVEPASWARVGRRALIFAPLMFITIRLLERGEAIGTSLVRTVVLLGLFLPFSYVMDSMLYRSHLRRTGAKSPDGKKR